MQAAAEVKAELCSLMLLLVCKQHIFLRVSDDSTKRFSLSPSLSLSLSHFLWILAVLPTTGQTEQLGKKA